MEEYIEKLVMQKAQLQNNLAIALTVLKWFMVEDDTGLAYDIEVEQLERLEPATVKIRDGVVHVG